MLMRRQDHVFRTGCVNTLTCLTLERVRSKWDVDMARLTLLLRVRPMLSSQSGGVGI